MLEVRDVYAGYGKIPVLHGVSLCVPPKTVVTLLGTNGAGKTTTLRSIVGLIPVSRGRKLPSTGGCRRAFDRT